MRRASTFLRRLHDDRSGASAVVTSLAMIVVLGAAGLGTDVAGWYAARRDAQHAADSAAVSAATALAAGGDDLQAQARAIAATYGVRHGQNGVVVTGRELAGSGGPQVEVLIERPARRFFSQLLLVQARTIRASAVAQVGGAGDGCVLALHPSAREAVYINGSAKVGLKGCSLIANSTDSRGLFVKGSADLSAESIVLGGGYETQGSATVDGKILTQQPPVADPYANVKPFTAFTGCTHPTKVDIKGEQTFDARNGPIIFCGGLAANGSERVTFLPGVYVFDGGEFSIGGNAEVVAKKDVTIVLTTSRPGGKPARINFNGSGVLELDAPDAGDYAGIAIFQSNREAVGDKNYISGNADIRITGAIYLPKQVVEYSGSSNTGSACTQLIAAEITLSGSTDFAIQCEGTGVRPIGGARTKLVR